MTCGFALRSALSVTWCLAAIATSVSPLTTTYVVVPPDGFDDGDTDGLAATVGLADGTAIADGGADWDALADGLADEPQAARARARPRIDPIRTIHQRVMSPPSSP